jgi:hypothetical protein
MADQGQHGEYCLHKHAILPLAALTQFEVRGIALCRMKGGCNLTMEVAVLLTLSVA